MAVSQKLLDHALPNAMLEARSVAEAGIQDTNVLNEGPVLFGLPGMKLFSISGRDRSRFLHAMLSADVTALSAGEGAWATFNDVKGRTISDIRLLVMATEPKEGSMWALVEDGARDVLTEALDRFVIAEKVYFEDMDNHSLWLLTGEKCEDALKAAGGSPPQSSLFAHATTTLGDTKVHVARMDRSAASGRDLLLIVDKVDEGNMLDALSSVPRGEGILLEAARIEAGQPRFGIDFTQANIPLEAGLADRAINFNKGCYPGQEVICRINSLGAPARRLMRLSIEADQAPEPGSLLFRDGREVGYITSAVRSQRVGPVAAMGYLGKRHCDQGTTLQVGEADAETSAQVIEAV